jgi:glycosyltransferase involved in cell wall biosynthesis
VPTSTPDPRSGISSTNPMPLRVVLYCPDRHLTYDGRTPDEIGVGGGVTARVRMARALARPGHSVTHVVNCPRQEMIDGVAYCPLDEAGRLEADVVVFNTSGGALDLSPALELDITARLRIVWVHGTRPPGGLDRVGYDSVYAVSNFLGRIVVDAWGVPAEKVFVTYNGYEPSHFTAAEADAPERDPLQLIYYSHPSKGLETALAVVTQLRRAQPRFHLEVVGGARLWGSAEAVPVSSEGVRDHGLLGQRALVPLLLRSTYAMQMQDREEPFGLSVVEAMRAGLVVVASPVGALPELITDRVTGMIVPGDHRQPSVRQAAADAILRLHTNPVERDAIVRRARGAAPDTDTLARAWVEDWRARLGEAEPSCSACSHCGGRANRLAGGDHCTACGRFTSRLGGVGR